MALLRQLTDAGTPKQGFLRGDRQRLGLRDVRRVFRLLSEVRDLGASPLAWRPHMVPRLLGLVDGATGVAAEAVIPRRPGDPRLLGTVIAGVRDPRRVSVYRAVVERGGYSLDLRHEGLADRPNSTVTRTRQQMAENRPWHQRPDLDPWRTLGCEHFICSKQYVPGSRCVHLIILTRSSGKHPFAELERRTVALFHAELGRLWRRIGDDSGADLSPPLQRTLDRLLDGSSEGEIVSGLGLSPHTVHDHVKRLYRHFRVNSRAQLLACLSRSPSIRAPRLCVNLLKGEDDRRFDAVKTAEANPGHEASTIKPVKGGRRPAKA